MPDPTGQFGATAHLGRSSAFGTGSIASVGTVDTIEPAGESGRPGPRRMTVQPAAVLPLVRCEGELETLDACLEVQLGLQIHDIASRADRIDHQLGGADLSMPIEEIDSRVLARRLERERTGWQGPEREGVELEPQVCLGR